MNRPSLHKTVARTLYAPAPPAVVFPLLCPVREREWVKGWEASVLHSVSGVAEKGCVFSAFDSTWVVTAYEPTKRIEFVIAHATKVETLAIEIAQAGEGTRMTWTRAYTGLTDEGNAWIEVNVPDTVYARLGDVEAMLVSYIQGRCLRQ